MCSTQVKIQEKHLLPFLVLLSEMRCNVSRTEETTGVDYKCVWSLCLAIYFSNFAFTYSNGIICGRKSKSIPTSVIHKVLVASGSAYLMFKKCSDRARRFKQDLLGYSWSTWTQAIGFLLVFAMIFCWTWDKLTLIAHMTGVLGWCNLLAMRFLFLKNADFQAAARFPELLPVLIIWKFTVCISN